MPLIFRCQCNQKLRVSRRKSGTMIRCPKCECSLLVPELQQSEDKTMWVEPMDQTHEVTAGELLPPAASPNQASPADRMKSDAAQYESRLIRNPSAAPPTDEAKRQRLMLMGSFAVLGLCLVVAGIILAAILLGNRAPLADRHESDPAIPSDGSKLAAKEKSSPVNQNHTGPRSPRTNPNRETVNQTRQKKSEPGTSQSPTTKTKPTRVKKKQNTDPNQSTVSHSVNPLQALERLMNRGDKTRAQDVIDAVQGNQSYPPEIPGMIDELGLNYFTDQLTDLVFLNVDKIIQDRGGKLTLTEMNPLIDKMESLTGRDSESIENMICGMSGIVRSVISFRSQPQMFLIRYKEPVDVSRFEHKKELQSSTIAGVKVYADSDGVCYGIPEPNVLLCGSRNEVLFALRFHDREKNFSHFAWLDFRKHDSAYFQARQSAAGFFGYSNLLTSNGNRIRSYRKSQSKRHAQLAARHANLYQKLQQGDVTAEQFWRDYEAIADELRFPFARPTQAIIAQTAKQASAAKKYALQMKEMQEIKHMHQGDTLIIETKYLKQSQSQTLWNAVSALSWRNSMIRGAQSRNEEFRGYLEKFETYQFKSKSDRENLESRLIRNTMSSQAGRMLFSDSYVLGEYAFGVNHTSSRRARNFFLMSLAELTSPGAIEILSLEAQLFDLDQGFRWTGEEDDKPDFLKDESHRSREGRRTVQNGKLKKTLTYYLECPGDPATVIAVCHILNDVIIKELKPALLRIEKDTLQPDKVREASRRALAAYLDPSKRNHNINLVAKDIDECKKWLAESFRPNRMAAIRWTMQNDWPTESRPEIIKHLILLLDDAIHCQDALASLKKSMKPDEVAPLHTILTNAMDRSSGYRQRQDFTLVRVVDLLAHLKDTEGLLLSLQQSEYEVTKFAKQKLIELKLDAGPLVDELMSRDLSTKGHTRNLINAVEQMTLTEEQQTKVENWVEKQIANEQFGLSLWALYRKCKPFRKENIKTLVTMWAEDVHSSSSIAVYLKKYGPAIEPQLLAAIRDCNQDQMKIWSSVLCDLLGEVGTIKSIEVIEPYLNHRRTNDQERAQATIDKIRSANRQAVDFESFAEPGK